MSHWPRILRRIWTMLHHGSRRKARQLHRMSHRTLQFSLLLAGAAMVSFMSLGFARMVDLALHWNATWIARVPWAIWIALPLGMVCLRWATLRFAPNAAGSGIPQVIASLSLPASSGRLKLVTLYESMWKVPLTFLGLVLGASIGREGPSVQVGAALMLAWGRLCKKMGVPLTGVQTNELIATGAAGGLAAAFNAPLAGVVFAIEELGRGTALRWQRLVLLGVLAAGFIVVVFAGNNPYFGTFTGHALEHNMAGWVLLCGLVCGIGGGIFSWLLSKGAAAFAPARWRDWLCRRPLHLAFFMGLILAALGLLTHYTVFGTGYEVASSAMAGHSLESPSFGPAKLLATVVSYWAGIPGGIFTPALTAGAGFGVELYRWTGALADQRVLVLLCMASFLAAATQSPLTASVIVMEMTGSQPMLVWLLIASLCASLVSRLFSPQPFYHYSAGRFRQQVRESDIALAKTASAASPKIPPSGVEGKLVDSGP
ncbi:MAG TPA: chloride channel protein [Eoetvoesiella sp.]|jgi:H+/Cl- antiporter ClcA|uniref:chloride channel protein n=1 Tax=Eoetvoesiella sp. TaxID=1966355 RepID=UPI002BB1D979|nr:chloride channel protein [Eoetvoesiella sp.]HWK60341.1 chloride channel protein [Eoetvoesiella sp.]